MSIIKKHDETINLKRRGESDLRECIQEFDLLLDKRIVTVKKERLINEIYSDNASINNYIHSITYSLVCYDGSNQKGEEACYYTDTKGDSKEIELAGMRNMIMKNAPLIITPEGIILMFQNNLMVATLDLYTEKYIEVMELELKAVCINKIFVENKKTFVEYMTKDGIITKKEILFSFDFTSKNAPSSVIKVSFK